MIHARAASTETHVGPPKTAPNSSKNIGTQLNADLQLAAPKTMIQKSVSPKMAVFGDRQADFVKSQSLLPKEGVA